MKKLLILVLCFAVSLCFLTSCNGEVSGSGEGGKSKVYFIGVGLQYDIPYVSVNTNTGSKSLKLGIMDGSENGAVSPYLAGTINDICEFTTAYGLLLEQKGIEYEDYLFLQKGTPWYSDISCSYSVTSSYIRYDATVDSFKIGTTVVKDQDLNNFDFSAVHSAYKTWISDNKFAPTKENILKFIKTDLSNKVKEGDLVVFLYSGHGMSGTGSMSVLPSEFCPYVNTPSARNGAGDNKLTPVELVEALDCLPCKKVLFFDSCYSANAINAVQDEFFETGMMSYLGSEIFESIDMKKGLLSAKADMDNICILASTDVKHSSLDDVVIRKGDYLECHGQMMSIMLEAFGWHHSDIQYTTTISKSEKNLTTAEDIKVYGSSDLKPGFAGPFTVDSIFSYVRPIQDKEINNKYNLSMTSGSSTFLLLP